MKLEEIIYRYAEENGIKDVGICNANDFLLLKDTLEKNNERLKGFVEQDINKRISPSSVLTTAKSIIVFAIGYKKKFNFKIDNNFRGKISEGAIGEDYHITLKNKFIGLADKLLEVTSFEYKIYVDTGPLVDREVSKRAGIGFYGKNGALISKVSGSKIFLGYMVTDLDLCGSNVLEDLDICNGCMLCINNCPAKVIGSIGNFKYEKCISYLTQAKGLIALENMKIMELQIYGCDVCQNVCPKNKNIDEHEITEIEVCMPKLQDLISMTNRDFDDKYKKTAMGWRGKKIIQRNAVVALGNTKSKDALEILKVCLRDERELIRHTAVRSIYNLGFNEGFKMLEEHLNFEHLEEIAVEIKQMLKNAEK